MLPIRANANTVINENSPSDARQLLAYYNLEQYPETKLFYGPMFSDMYAGQDDLEPYIDDKPKYERDDKTGRYVIVNHWENAPSMPTEITKGFYLGCGAPNTLKTISTLLGRLNSLFGLNIVGVKNFANVLLSFAKMQ